MAFEEVEHSLPNGFHDAKIERISLDYPDGTLRKVMRGLPLRMLECLPCFLCALVFVALSVGTTSGQSPASGTKVGGMAHEGSLLEVTLKTDRDSYKLGDEISFQVLLINTSKSPLYIYAPLDWGESASLSLWLKDAVSGKDVPEQFIADALPPPPGSKDAFVRLPPDHVYGVVLRSRLAQLNVQKSGTYELVAEYHSPIPSSMNFGLPIWSREKGAVPSNRVTIRVGE